MDGVLVEDGLATLGPAALALRSELDGLFVTWARHHGAREMAFPALLEVPRLARLDYFQNFPHLGLLASGLAADALAGPHLAAPERIAPEHLAGARYVLPSAACFSLYLHLEGRALDQPLLVTVVANCFRREEGYAGLRRLHGFTMREIVCVGSRDAVLAHLDRYERLVLDCVAALGLPVEVAAAADPFFDRSGSRALTQQLFPVKRELIYGGDLAIASMNFHRNFFGERCDIRLAGEHAFSGCVAFGLERWMAALCDRLGPDLDGIRQRVAAVVRSAREERRSS